MLKINGGFFMTLKRTTSLFGIIALVAVIGFFAAACGDGGDGDKGDPTFLGDTLTLSGQVYTVQRGGTPQKPSINYQKFTADLPIDNTHFISIYGGSGEIKNGQFSYTLGTPKTLIPLTSSSAITIFYDDDYYDGVTLSNSTTKGLILTVFLVSGSSDYNTLAKFNISVSGNSVTMEYVYFVYVDKDLTISGKGKTTDDEDGEFTTKDFKLALKAGWNAIHWKTTGSSEKSTETISLGNPSLKWVLIGDSDDY
jgi:hypothetical protein